MSTESKSNLRQKFFEFLFQDYRGWLCIAVKNPDLPVASFRQKFFSWPDDYNRVENFIISVERTHDVYFCVNLLAEQARKKENCLPTDLLWADLDDADISKFPVPPQVVLVTSPGRTQALWKLTTKLPAQQAESYCRRLAYVIGADRSGWDLTQLLRVPFTKNQKYAEKPEVLVDRILEGVGAVPLLFESLDVPPEDQPQRELPETKPDHQKVLYKYTIPLRHTQFAAIYTQEPSAEEDWSSLLWRLLHICFEAGMTAEEAFAVAESAPCNKYARDNRPITHLWRDVLKCELAHKNITAIGAGFEPLVMPLLVDEPAGDTFIDRYRDWATEATDAVPIFHDLCSAILLSAIIANSVRLETSYGSLVPNIWGLILGDSTLTRKTTAMRMVIDFLAVLDSDMVMATDGSPEGLLTGLEQRPNKVSIFYKDEVSGFFDSINRKDYLAGMPETLTALYDVPPIFTRRLRKSTIHIESPAFIFFGGGVPGTVYDALRDDYVLSGFLPRFLVVNGEASLDKLRRTGPPNEIGIAKRAAIADEVANLYEYYATDVKTRIGGQSLMMPSRVAAEFSQSAWDRYGSIEELMVETAAASSIPDLALPTFERLSRSIIKLSVILGASRQQPNKDHRIKIEDKDVVNAAWLVQKWGNYSVELIANAGKKSTEKLLDKIVKAIEEHPGILRGTLMQHYHLMKHDADIVLSTLEDRQLVRKEQQGRGWRYYIS